MCTSWTRTADNMGLGGVTFLASASNRGVPGRGDSYDVSLGQLGGGGKVRRCGTTSGDSLSFTSRGGEPHPRRSQPRARHLPARFRSPRPEVEAAPSGEAVAFRDGTPRSCPPLQRVESATALPSIPRPTTAAAMSRSRRSRTTSYQAIRTHVSDVLMRGMNENRNKPMWWVSKAKMTGPGQRGLLRPDDHEPRVDPVLRVRRVEPPAEQPFGAGCLPRPQLHAGRLLLELRFRRTPRCNRATRTNTSPTCPRTQAARRPIPARRSWPAAPPIRRPATTATTSCGSRRIRCSTCRSRSVRCRI